MTHAQVIAGLTQKGVRRDLATMYADAFVEYQDAVRNIRVNGAIVQHPRTRNPIENPYCAIRDRARAALQKMKVPEAEYLWIYDDREDLQQTHEQLLAQLAEAERAHLEASGAAPREVAGDTPGGRRAHGAGRHSRLDRGTTVDDDSGR